MRLTRFRPSGLGAALVVALCAACGNDVAHFTDHDFTSDPPPPGPLNGLIVTSNNGQDTLSAIDAARPQAIWSIPVGFIPVELEGPHHVAADPAGQFVYVNLSEAVANSGTGPHGSHGTGTQPGYVLQLSALDAHLVAYAMVEPNPGDNTIAPDGKTLYVTHYDLIKWSHGALAGDLRLGDSDLAILDPARMDATPRFVPICPAAHGARLSPDAATLYTTCGPDEIAVVGVGDPAVPVRRVLLPRAVGEGGSCDHCPYALGVAPDGTVWVSSLGPAGGGSGGGGVNVYDPAAGDFDPARSVGYCGRAVFAAFSHAAGPYRVYVPEQGPCGDVVHIYDPKGPGQAPLEIGRIGPFAPGQCQNAHMVLVSADDRWGYLVCEGDHRGPGTFLLLDLEARVVQGAIPIGVFPDGLALVPPSSR